MRFVSICGLALAVIAAPVAAHAQQATHNWSGFYAGLHAGYGWGDNDVDVGCKDPSGSYDGTANCSIIIATGEFPSNFSTNFSGFIGGAQAGYNFQSGNLVFGFEADISWTSIDGSDSKSPAPVVFASDFESARVSQDVNWLGTLRGRLGYATGNWLLFATGGLAYANVDYRYSYRDINSGAIAFTAKDSASSSETGWTVGGGAELALGKWSLKGEYLFYDLGEESLNAELFTGAGARFSDVSFPSDFETQGHIARIGVNYHFD